MAWRDVTDGERVARWGGLVFGHPSAASGRGFLQAQVARDPARLMRIVAGSRTVLWARVADDHCDYEYLIACSVWKEGCEVIPPLLFAAVHQAGEASPDDREKHWARQFAEALVSAQRGPIGRDEYVILPLRDGVPTAAHWQDTLKQAQADEVRWDFGTHLPPLTLRDPASVDSGRVRAWRKVVRAGTLPPVLLWWVSGLDRFVVLDGLHRAVAALEEETLPPCFALTRYAWQAPAMSELDRAAMTRGIEQALNAPRPGMTVENANRLLVRSYHRPAAYWTTTAWPIPGGQGRWLREVREELGRCQVPDWMSLAKL